jgi:hypothetical protein
VRSQAGKIAKLKMAYADLKREKDNVIIGYRRLVAKHDAFMEKAEQEKAKLAEAHVEDVDKLCGYLDLETCSYMEYHQTVRRRLRKLNETVALSFDEVKCSVCPSLAKVRRWKK